MAPTRTFLSIVSVLLLAAVALRIAEPTPVARLSAAVFDSYLRLSPRVLDPALPVRIVAIDEASLEKFGQWPWPRTHLADLIGVLWRAGAKVIALDIVMPEPDRLSPDVIARALAGAVGSEASRALVAQLTSGDGQLGAAITNAQVAIGFMADDSTGRLPEASRARFTLAGDDPKPFVRGFRGAVSSLPLITAGARGYGAVNWWPEHDQILRRVPLLVSAAGALHPSLALEALRLANGETTVQVKSSGSSGQTAFGQRTGVEYIRIGRTVLPTTARGEFWLRFSPPDDRRYLSAQRVLASDFDAREVAGRLILIGGTAVGLKDFHATPLAEAVPGVEVHAQALEQMLAGAHLVRPAYALGAEIVLLLVVGALVAWLIWRFGPLQAAAAAAGASAAVIVLSWLAYLKLGLLFDPIYPTLAITALYVAGSLETFVRTEVARVRMQVAFGHYVSPAVIDELARHPEKLKLGGEMRELTLLFADIRQFSRIAETLDAQALIAFANRFFGPMSDIILRHRGTIDKFMGAAVMAFWNAPLADPLHAPNACRAALAMVDELARLNETWAAQAAARNEPHTDIKIGVGLNTGACCVGNIGSHQRFDYSILGDAVNVAARLEAATKTYGVAIVCGERTVQAAPGFAFLEIDRTELRGRAQAECIYALLGDEGMAASAAFATVATAHQQVLDRLRGDERTAAEAAIVACEQLALPGYAPLAAFYRSHLAARRLGDRQ